MVKNEARRTDSSLNRNFMLEKIEHQNIMWSFAYCELIRVYI